MGELSNQNRYLRLTQLHATVLDLCSSNSLQPVISYHAPRRRQHRLSPKQVLDLITAYGSGVAVNELAERFSIHRSTVLDHLNRVGIPRRYSALSLDQIGEATQLYRAGQSLRELGLHYRVHASTVRTALLRLGIKLRDQHGHER
jgi:DNA-binding CsgD family transcriptional regulator